MTRLLPLTDDTEPVYTFVNIGLPYAIHSQPVGSRPDKKPQAFRHHRPPVGMQAFLVTPA